jgi:transposase
LFYNNLTTTTGERCYKTQLTIDGKTYSTIAACTPLGFLCWEIFDHTINSTSFGNFIEKTLHPFISPDRNWIVLDNASTHQEEKVRQKMEEFLYGRYYFCAAYSPHLKPIEKCFSLIKRYIDLLDGDNLTAVEKINRAFHDYSLEGIS